MSTKRHHLIFLSSTLAGTAISAPSCVLDIYGEGDTSQVSGSSGTSSSSSSSTGSSTGGAGGIAGSGGGGGIAGAGGGTGGAGGASCPGMQTMCDGVCVDTSTDSTHCGDCTTVCMTGFMCVAGACQPNPICTPGNTQPCYTGPVGTAGVGQCKEGTETCAADGSSWGACMNEVLPATETCGNAVDEDCNGTALTGSVCLVSTNLVVRYFLDEAQGGKGPTDALDDAPAALNLPITYDAASNQLAYTFAGTGKGLHWNASDGLGVAKTVIDNTKIKTVLEGKQKGTIEVVAQLAGASGYYNRLLAIGTGGNNQFSLGVYSTPRFSFELNNNVAIDWNADFVAMGRVVVHAVVDTTDATDTNRIKLYIDGVLQTATAGTQPAQNTTFALGTGNSICLGNRDSQGRSINGSLYYAAVYAGALSAAEVQTNVGVLKAGDDK